MLLKLGVDISRLKRPVRRILPIVSYIWIKYDGTEAVITSTYEGDHRPDSLHYANLAVDIRRPRSNPDQVVKKLREVLGHDFDVVDEGTHIHIEYDPKK